MSLPGDVMERILAAADQSTKVACSAASKAMCVAARAPSVWTEVHILTLGDEAVAFLDRCYCLRTVHLTVTNQDLVQFLTAQAWVGVTTVHIDLNVPAIATSVFGSITAAFPSMQHLYLTVRGLHAYTTLDVRHLTLETLHFTDFERRIALECRDPVDIGLATIEVDELCIAALAHPPDMDSLCIAASGLEWAHLPRFRVRELMVIVDDDFSVPDHDILAETVIFLMQGHTLRMSMHTLLDWDCDVRFLNLHPATPSTLVFHDVDNIREFFNSFYTTHTRMHISDQTRVMFE